jgi:hypothetical protein
VDSTHLYRVVLEGVTRKIAIIDHAEDGVDPLMLVKIGDDKPSVKVVTRCAGNVSGWRLTEDGVSSWYHVEGDTLEMYDEAGYAWTAQSAPVEDFQWLR